MLLHVSDTAIQEGILEEELGHALLPIAPVVHWQCVLTGPTEGPGILPVSGHKGFQSVACNTVPKQKCYLSFEALKPGIDLASLRTKVLSGIIFEKRELSFMLNMRSVK